MEIRGSATSVWMPLDRLLVVVIFLHPYRACDRLRCTSCDFQVVWFNDFVWHTRSDYLFFRNNVPDFGRLKKNLVRKKG